MAYNQALVLAGGVAHVPILITILKFWDGRSSKLYNAKKAAEDLAKEKAKAAAAAAAAQAKAAAEKAATVSKAVEEISKPTENSES